MRFHDLRHTCAAIAIDKDVHPKVMSVRLAHKST
jgi:integrase